MHNLFKPCLFCFTLSQKLASFANIFSLSFEKNRLSWLKDHKDLKKSSLMSAFYTVVLCSTTDSPKHFCDEITNSSKKSSRKLLDISMLLTKDSVTESWPKIKTLLFLDQGFAVICTIDCLNCQIYNFYGNVPIRKKTPELVLCISFWKTHH